MSGFLSSSRKGSLVASKMKCPACNSKFSTPDREPKVLVCGHSICSVCLSLRLIPENVDNIKDEKHHLSEKQKESSNDDVLCPVCRRGINLSSEDVLPTNFALLDLSSEDETSRNRTETLFCSACDTSVDLECLWVCSTCNFNQLCASCALKTHKTHEILEATVMETKWREAMEAESEKLSDQISASTDSAAATRNRIEELKRKTERIQMELWEKLQVVQDDLLNDIKLIQKNSVNSKGAFHVSKFLHNQAPENSGSEKTLARISDAQEKIDMTVDFIAARFKVCERAVDELSFLLNYEKSESTISESRSELTRRKSVDPSQMNLRGRWHKPIPPPLPPRKRHSIAAGPLLPIKPPPASPKAPNSPSDSSRSSSPDSVPFTQKLSVASDPVIQISL